MLNIIRSHIDLYLDQYESNNGCSTDYYSKTSQFHPMAAAKYILTLCSLYRSNLLSQSNLIKKIDTTLQQLNQSKLKINNKDDMYFWGLNFSWKSCGENDAFLITSAIVTHSLFELYSLVPQDNLLKNLSAKSMNGLEYWINNEKIYCSILKENVPIFSKCINEPIFNAAAYTYSVIIKYSKNQDVKYTANRFMNKLWKYKSLNVGWKYSKNSNIIDLLHTCYILNSYYLSTTHIDKYEFINILSQFINNNYTFFDTGILKDSYKLWDGGIRKSINKEQYIEFKDKEARLWSVGELIVLLANLNLDRKDPMLEKFSRKIVNNILLLDFEEEKKYFRHTMHYTHGLAVFLEILRSK